MPLKVDLRKAKLSDGQCSILVQAIAEVPIVRKIDLSNNALSAPGLQPLVDLMQQQAQQAFNMSLDNQGVHMQGTCRAVVVVGRVGGVGGVL